MEVKFVVESWGSVKSVIAAKFNYSFLCEIHSAEVCFKRPRFLRRVDRHTWS